MDVDRVRTIASAVRVAIGSCAPADLPWLAFPGGALGDTSLPLGQVLHDAEINGFEYICGNRHGPGGSSSHAWLSDGEWIVDITADQFPDVAEQVIVSRDSLWHTTWEHDRPTPGTLTAYGADVPQLWRLLSLLRPLFALGGPGTTA